MLSFDEQALAGALNALVTDGQAAFGAACTQRQFGVVNVDDEMLVHATEMLDELWSHLCGTESLSSHALWSRSHYALAYMFEFGDRNRFVDVENPLASLAMALDVA